MTEEQIKLLRETAGCIDTREIAEILKHQAKDYCPVCHRIMLDVKDEKSKEERFNKEEY